MQAKDLIGKPVFISGYIRNQLFRIDRIDWVHGQYECTDLLVDDPESHPTFWSEYKIRMGFNGNRTYFRSIKVISEEEVEEYRRNQIVRKIMEE